MKLRSRLASTIVAAALILSLLLFKTTLKIRYRKAIGLLPDRLVIFGTAQSTVHALTKRSPTPAESTWTTDLCAQLHASCDSFAPPNDGAVVDNIVYNASIPDLRSQVDNWLEFETKARKDGAPAERSSLFTVFFGMNDIFKFSTYERAAGQFAVEASLDSMFEQLSRIAEHWPDPLQVLMPLVLDVTQLPAWRKTRAENDISGQEMRNAVALQAAWNKGVKKRVQKWKLGKVMLWDTNSWFMSNVRSPKWTEVRKGCVEKEGMVCQHPEEFLMWDDYRLSPKAHGLMAEEVLKYLVKDEDETPREPCHSHDRRLGRCQI